jgi:IS5 family transposase
MRDIFKPQLDMEFEPRRKKNQKKLKKMDEVLKSDKGILELVAKDLSGETNPNNGRTGMSAEQVLRVAIVKQMYQLSYDKLSELLDDSSSLRTFCKYGWEEVPEASTLQDNIKKIKPETFEAVNRAILAYAEEKGVETSEKVRIDTLAVETNIHYPTDARLVFDCVKVITRLLGKANKLPGVRISFVNHTRVAKKRVREITDCRKEDERAKLYADLLKLATEVLADAREGAKHLRSFKGGEEEMELGKLMAVDVDKVADMLEKIINQTRRRIINRESVPASEKILSIFEEHTDIIEKGGRETVFGHKVCISAGNHLILDAIIERGNSSDASIFPKALDRVIEIKGGVPLSTAADGGFTCLANEEYAASKGVKNVYFTKTAKRGSKSVLSDWQRKFFRGFRAGIEGMLSTMKRVRGLTRCLWRGWESFQSYVWCSVVAENIGRISSLLLRREALSGG